MESVKFSFLQAGTGTIWLLFETGLQAWVFDGGQDTNNVDSVALWYEEKLADGDKYTLVARGGAAGSSKDGYEYTI